LGKRRQDERRRRMTDWQLPANVFNRWLMQILFNSGDQTNGKIPQNELQAAGY
jgi:hypothetical protein